MHHAYSRDDARRVVIMSANSILLETEVENWGERCAEYSRKHGKENPDLLVEYGKALFNMAKRTASVLNADKAEQPMPYKNPRVKLPDLDSDDENNDENEEEAGNEGEAEAEAEAEAETEETADEAPLKISKHNESTDQAEAGDDGNEEDEGDDDFTAAFEILDIARVLYSQEEQTDEVKQKLINTRQLLGDVSLEDDNPTQAIEDYLATIELKKQFFGPESGELSITEYTLSLAYDALGKQEECIEHLKNAANCAKKANLPSAAELEQRVADAEEDLKVAAKMKGKDAKQARNATQEGIIGRSAIGDAIQSLVQGANDISQLTRKRKRDNKTKKEDPKETDQRDTEVPKKEAKTE